MLNAESSLLTWPAATFAASLSAISVPKRRKLHSAFGSIISTWNSALEAVLLWGSSVTRPRCYCPKWTRTGYAPTAGFKFRQTRYCWACSPARTIPKRPGKWLNREKPDRSWCWNTRRTMWRRIGKGTSTSSSVLTVGSRWDQQSYMYDPKFWRSTREAQFTDTIKLKNLWMASTSLNYITNTWVKNKTNKRAKNKRKEIKKQNWHKTTKHWDKVLF